jgi:hypothetical protein
MVCSRLSDKITAIHANFVIFGVVLTSKMHRFNTCKEFQHLVRVAELKRELSDL